MCILASKYGLALCAATAQQAGELSLNRPPMVCSCAKISHHQLKSNHRELLKQDIDSCSFMKGLEGLKKCLRENSHSWEPWMAFKLQP